MKEREIMCQDGTNGTIGTNGTMTYQLVMAIELLRRGINKADIYDELQLVEGLSIT